MRTSVNPFYRDFFNPLTTNVPIIETGQLICIANQLAGFYMMRTLVVKGLNEKGPGASFPTTFFVELLDKRFSFVI